MPTLRFVVVEPKIVRFEVSQEEIDEAVKDIESTAYNKLKFEAKRLYDESDTVHDRYIIDEGIQVEYHGMMLCNKINEHNGVFEEYEALFEDFMDPPWHGVSVLKMFTTPIKHWFYKWLLRNRPEEFAKRKIM